MTDGNLPNWKAKDYVPMPAGKIADTRLPDDWNDYVGDNVARFVKQPNGDSVVQSQYGRPLIITTVPPRSASEPEDPDGYTEFMCLSEDTKNKVFNYPGFPKRLDNPKVPNYVVKKAPGMGLGVYATRDLDIGDFIWAERPLIVKSAATVSPVGATTGEHHTASEVHMLNLKAGERTIEQIVERLTPERRARYMSLANAHTEDGSGPLTGIMRTNQLELRLVEGVPGADPKDTYWRYCAIADVLSRTNHSCIPNIHHVFDYASFSLRIYAFARIKKGDQLVWSYIDPRQDTPSRQRDLAPYGFSCKCRLCSNPSEKKETEWDTLIDRTYGFTMSIMKTLVKQDLDTPWNLLSRDERLALKSRYEWFIFNLEKVQAEMDSYGEYGALRLLCCLHELHKRSGNKERTSYYANLVVKWMKCYKIMDEPYL